MTDNEFISCSYQPLSFADDACLTYFDLAVFVNHRQTKVSPTGQVGGVLSLPRRPPANIFPQQQVVHQPKHDQGLRHMLSPIQRSAQTGCAAGRGDEGESSSLGQGLELGTPQSGFLAGFEWAVDETAWNAVIDNR